MADIEIEVVDQTIEIEVEGQGPRGPQGYQGYQGNQGNQGNQGVGGSAGSQGPQGYQGYQGNQGNQGNQGVGGSAGSQGPQGYQGYQGVAPLYDPFQTPAFANPLNLDATSHKDFICSSVTGNTTVNLNNSSNGDSGMIELKIDSTGGYTITLGSMFTKKVGSGSIQSAANKDNFISWRRIGTDIVYTIGTI
jgi:hypothetical protein